MNKAVEKIAELIHIDKHERHHIARAIIQSILSDPSIVEIEVDAELPDNVCENDDGKDFTIGYELAQQDMLKAGWVKKKC